MATPIQYPIAALLCLIAETLLCPECRAQVQTEEETKKVIAPSDAPANSISSQNTSGENGNRRDPIDPTVPSDEILRKLSSAKPSEPISRTLAPSASFKFPKLVLKAIVLKDSKNGTAIIESGNQRFRVQLSHAKSPKWTLPLAQTAKIDRAISELGISSAAELSENENAKSDTQSKGLYTIDSNCLQIDDLFFQVESFDDQILLLKAIPTGFLFRLSQ